LNYIELFAGCGGLSLGLKSTGFQLAIANELSPMAAETYAYNFLNEDLSGFGAAKPNSRKTKTLWLSSKYSLDNFNLRLRENPFEFPPLKKGHSDLDEDGSNLDGALVVGNLIQLNEWLSTNNNALKKLKNSFGRGEVDLISGGPPCQSFSMAGLREKDAEKNSLPWEFAKFVESVKPKFALLENVTGILRPFSGKDGARYYAWFELAKAFSEIGYIPLCLHVNAKFTRVPQNRPRFILLGIRSDLITKLHTTFNKSEKQLLEQPISFYTKITEGNEVSLSDLSYRDISKPSDLNIFDSTFLSPLSTNKNFVSVRDAINDLSSKAGKTSQYPTDLDTTFAHLLRNKKIANHELRKNNDLVRRRFRVYQLIEAQSGASKKEVLDVMQGRSNLISISTWGNFSDKEFLLESGAFDTFKSKKSFTAFLQRHSTKKRTQKALNAAQPAPAALSIPDDACHYAKSQLRTLTVREMARIQSFPDSFTFCSKITTGGNMRRFEVPQYTQVGNAVPPLLGRALGLVISDLLTRIKTC
jgi:DNA (cytosine-5)-methyltransferase 1